MSIGPYTHQAALADFQEARMRAALRDVLALLTRSSDELLSYEEVAEHLQLSARGDAGIQTIPVSSIVGSVGRSADFTRDFLPRRGNDSERWARVRNAFIDPSRDPLPPIEVYQVGEVYFVLDGNHRVSVAKSQGIEFIEAHVIEIQTPVPLTPDLTPDDLICKAEMVQFLLETGLREAAPDFDFTVTLCGSYPKLREQVVVHQLRTGRAMGRDIPLTEAASNWLGPEYAPLVRALRDRGLLRWFPDRTETDLYLWVTAHQHQLRDELGWDVRPDAAATDIVVRKGPRAVRGQTAERWQSERLTDRYIAHLFMDILVPLSGDPDAWDALDQALHIAQKEQARVYGLHVTAGRNRATAEIQALEARFMELCAGADVAGDFAVETGDISRKISDRALLTDLIVLNVAHPPASGISALTSGWREILTRAARPVLAVPNAASAMERALLVYDGGEKSKQALFVAAYLGEMWQTALTVLIVNDASSAAADAANYARAYLELHELDAEFVSAQPTSQFILDTLASRNLDTLLLGSDHASQWQTLRGRSVVGTLLRDSPCPILICQ